MTIRGVRIGVLLVAVASGCAQHPTEEIAFSSGSFRIVGDLRLPEGAAPHPVVLFVHGDGANDRTSGVTYPPIMERMLRAGYATFAWDKPGTGESSGTIDRSRIVEQRSAIVLDAIEMLKQRPDIDAGRIGLWGISQAGYVMPVVLSRSDDVAFMIAVSCPGEPGVEQGIHLLASQMVCSGYPVAEKEGLERSIRAFTLAETYDEYVQYFTPLAAMPTFRALARFGQRVEVASEDDWHPADMSREYYGYDPMDIIGRARIPILAFFGERDTQADPIQGLRAYREAFERGGDPRSRAVLIPGVDHNLIVSETGCIAERDNRSRAGWRNYPAEYLDTLEEWLTTLRR